MFSHHSKNIHVTVNLAHPFGLEASFADDTIPRRECHDSIPPLPFICDDGQIVQKWKEMSCGLLGMDTNTSHNFYQKGQLIVFNQKVIGIYQATLTDHWIFPIDLIEILFDKDPRPIPYPLRVVKVNNRRFSTTLNAFLDQTIPTDRHYDLKYAANKPLHVIVKDDVASDLNLESNYHTQDPSPFLDVVCINNQHWIDSDGYLGSSLVTYFNGIHHPTFEQIYQLLKEKDNIIGTSNHIRVVCPRH
jgi:hypothetical protein